MNTPSELAQLRGTQICHPACRLNAVAKARLGRAALSCSRLWGWQDYRRLHVTTTWHDPGQHVWSNDRLNQQNLLKSPTLSYWRFQDVLSRSCNILGLAITADGTTILFQRCASPMLLAHCQSAAVRPVGLYLVPWSNLELAATLEDVYHAAERYVHPSFKWTLEVQNFILDRSMLSKSQQSEFKYFVPCSLQMPQKLSGINSRILGLHSLVRQLAFSALLLGSAGRFLLIEFGVMCFNMATQMTSMLVRYWWFREWLNSDTSDNVIL